MQTQQNGIGRRYHGKTPKGVPVDIPDDLTIARGQCMGQAVLGKNAETGMEGLV